MQNIISYQKKYLTRVAIMAMCVVGLSGVAAAADPVLSQEPLFIQKNLAPNIMLTLDNSASMPLYSVVENSSNPNGEYSSNFSDKGHYSSSVNKIYYDPAITYETAKDYDGTSLGNAAAVGTKFYAWKQIINPYRATSGTGSGERNETSNLVEISKTCFTSGEEPILPLYTMSTMSASTSSCIANSGTTWARYAFYYTLSGDAYTRVDILPTTVKYIRPSSRIDCEAPTTTGCTYEEEMRNFANWVTYYRTRLLTAQTVVSQTFSKLEEGKHRVGFGLLNIKNTDGKRIDGADTDNISVRKGVRAFIGGERKAWFRDYLFTVDASTASTPLRRALDDVGRYFSRADDKGPWGKYPGTGGGKQYSCRKKFHILMTDGYWNSDVASTSGTSKGDDEDGETITGPNGESYRYIAADNKPESTCIPGTGKCVASTYYNSAANNTVADVAMYYWKTDLRKGSSALDNNVPTSDDDPAFWQHVSQYTIALGVSGNIPHTPENETLLKKGVTNTNLCTWDSERKCIWPTNIPESNKAGIDDLWHAAVNGHGKHFSAKSPTEFSAGLTAALADISKVSATAASETASSTVVKEGVYLYTPSFTSGSWSGNLKAYPIDDSGVISPIASWEAASKIPVASSRNIVTWNGTKGVNFTWTSTASVETITEAQKKVVGSEDVLNYLRGDDSKEKSRANGIYRDRTSRLGDIINSAPLYVKNGADQGYSSMTTAVTISVDDQTEDTTMGALYQIFKKSKAARAAMLYVGANDGMLHAFSAADGIERFAYVPASVLGNMSKLSDTNYTLNHKYYVDGQLTEGDAYLGEKWRTVLLGTTGAGAKSVFAMDITNPGASYSGLTKDNVMWEQSDTDDVDMGNVLGDARVAQLNNGEWVAIHGNGYRSSSGKAVLYVRKLSDGSVYRKVEVDTTTGNGLSTPALEYNSKNQVIGAYAGDIKGSLWKFDLQTPTAPTSTKLFTAESGQPIIQRPVYKGHPQGGNMVMFGTGKYFDVGDGDTTTLQSLYSVWDKPYSDVKQSDLQKQILTAVKKGGSGSDKDDIIGASVTPASTAPKSPKGCYVDLTLNSGERAIANPLILDRVLIFKTLVPAAGGCTFGGESYLYGLNFLSCGAGANPYFGLLNILKLTGGGAGGLQVVQKKDGTVQVWTKSFKENEKTQKSEPNLVSPGFRTWRQIPVNY